ncbi:J domain-containing protein [Variovorax sp. Varisp41]|uniref:J domain-containing protein n=1 Tax=Variovorax sp. Varisp41 TaxID=3243033 RepID=UPI0039B6013A
MTITAYPLAWPEHRPRTAAHRVERSGFDRKRTFAVVRDELVREITRLGGRNLIISTNIPLRQDGLPYATYRQIQDYGVAVYFKYSGKDVCFACDRWARIEDNMHAIVKTIDALRGIARWGSGDMMAAAFTGFTALPSPTADARRHWRDVLGFALGDTVHAALITERYRTLASQAHPDKGGSNAAMAELNRARDEALRSLS